MPSSKNYVSASPTDYTAMSTKELRQLLTLSGEDCSAYLEKSELVAAAQRLDHTNFDDEAHKIFAQMNLQPKESNEFRNLDAIWRHKNADGTNGASVYVGNYIAASDRRRH